MKIKSFVGGHPIKIFANCDFDPQIRKFRGGDLVAVIPFSGDILSAKFNDARLDDLCFDGNTVPLFSKRIFTDVDDIPGQDVCDFCIVSALFVVACKDLGRDTSRLLTVSLPVVDDNDVVIGTIGLNKN